MHRTDQNSEIISSPSNNEVNWLLRGAAASMLSAVALSTLSAATAEAQSDYNSSTSSSRVEAQNAILFMVDDMSDIPCDEVQTYLPKSSKWLLQQGVCYENATTASPVCCPARAQVQSGRLPHNNGVIGQQSADKLDYRKTMQYTFSKAGYITYGIGKHLNGVDSHDYYGKNRKKNGYKKYDFWNSYAQEPGTFTLIKRNGENYRPNRNLNSAQVTGKLALDFVDKRVRDKNPFMVSVNFFAPHTQLGEGIKSALPPATRENAKKPITTFVCDPEKNAKDKLPIFRQRVTKSDCRKFERLYVARRRALLDVDHQMANVMQRLDEANILDDSVVIFTSDNGYSDQGQNNWSGKSTPYPASTNIPMLVSYPDKQSGIEDKPVSLIDIAPTFYDELKEKPAYKVDGRPLRGNYTRKGQYFELSRDLSQRAIKESGKDAAKVPSFKAFKDNKGTYVVWLNQKNRPFKREFYRDAAMERGSLNKLSPKLLKRYQNKIYKYSRCAGTSGRKSCT